MGVGPEQATGEENQALQTTPVFSRENGAALGSAPRSSHGQRNAVFPACPPQRVACHQHSTRLTAEPHDSSAAHLAPDPTRSRYGPASKDGLRAPRFSPRLPGWCLSDQTCPFAFLGPAGPPALTAQSQAHAGREGSPGDILAEQPIWRARTEPSCASSSARGGGDQPPTAMWPFPGPGPGSGPALLTVAGVAAGTALPCPAAPTPFHLGSDPHS